MTAEQSEHLRAAILLHLFASYPDAQRTSSLLTGVRMIGSYRALSAESLSSQLRYLEQKGMVEHHSRKLSGDIEFLITTVGRTYLDEEGLV